MPRGRKKDKTPKGPKYYEAPEVEELVRKVVKDSPNVLVACGVHDIKFLFKDIKIGQKNVWVKILKEPYTLITNQKVLFIMGADFWSTVDEQDRIKAIIEGLLGITITDDGELKKRKFDIITYSELIKDQELDFSKFSAVVSTKQKISKKEDIKIRVPEDLELKSED